MQRGRWSVSEMVMVLCECESGRSVCKVAKGDLGPTGLAFCWLAGWRGGAGTHVWRRGQVRFSLAAGRGEGRPKACDRMR
jgi:hypothetical protein